MLTCALCNGEITETSHFCATCGAPGPAATAEERITWRERRAPVASSPAPDAASAPQWAPPAPPAPQTPPSAPPSSWTPPPAAPSTPPASWAQPPSGPSTPPPIWGRSDPTSPPPPSSNPFSGWKLPAVPGAAGKVGNVAAKYVVLASAAGLAIGSFLPWARVDLGFLGNHTISGIDGGDGWFTLIAGLIVAVLALVNAEPIKAQLRNVFYGLGAGAAVFTLFEFGNAASKFDDISEVSEGMVNPHFGFGLFLLLIAAVGLIVGASKLKTEN